MMDETLSEIKAETTTTATREKGSTNNQRDTPVPYRLSVLNDITYRSGFRCRQASFVLGGASKNKTKTKTKNTYILKKT